MVGFDSQNKNTINVNYLCRICSLIYRDPIQLACGHRYCHSCIHQEVIMKCMQCDLETLNTKMFSDRGMKNDMETLNIICSLCYWNGLFKNYQGHLTKDHSKTSTDPCIGNYVLFQIRQLAEKINEYSNNVRILKQTIKEILFQTSIYKTSIEEENSPKDIPQQKEECIVSYDGTLLWKIDNIKNRLGGSKCFLTSSPFYTSPDGYKMCVRLYFNGDGIGRSTHLSIFLVLMRGEFDALLSWPFSFQVIVCLYDLTNQQNHITKSFLSDTKSKSFQRPQAEMNIGNGMSQFIPISLIRQENSPYTFDGSIYFKLMVRKDPIPTFILPHIMNIDHALPVYMQQDKIEETIAKYHAQSFKLTVILKSQR